jgi:hypothetical protein
MAKKKCAQQILLLFLFIYLTTESNGVQRIIYDVD